MPYCESCHEAAPFHELTAPRVDKFTAHGNEVPSKGRCLKCIAASEKLLLAAVIKAAGVLSDHHKWHQEYDEHGGYPDSDLCEKTTDAIREFSLAQYPAAKSVMDEVSTERLSDQVDYLTVNVTLLRDALIGCASLCPHFGPQITYGGPDDPTPKACGTCATCQANERIEQTLAVLSKREAERKAGTA